MVLADDDLVDAEPTSDDSLVGRCLNATYLIEGVIGEGGMGRVYRARHTRLGQKRFAIKVLRPEYARNAEVAARFRREAEAASSISHPNVVGVYDVDTSDDGFAYLVCEFLEGIDLGDFLESCKQLDIQTAVHIAVQICRALEAAHERGVVHRDLKPHNVFLLKGSSSGAVSSRPVAKVVDFGLSRFMDSGEQLTQTGIVMGTPAYMSPEQASAKTADHRSDVYGVGAILYTVLTGEPPFDNEDVRALLLAVLTEEPVPPRRKNPAIPGTLELVLQRAMARNPDERYQSMRELRQALEPFVESSSESSVSVSNAAPGRGSRAALDADARTLAMARPKLLLFALLTLGLFLAGFFSSLPSLELVTGKVELTEAELTLLGFGALGTLLTPALFLIVHLRKTVWRNHARVLELLGVVRSALLVGVVTYGCAALLVRLLDGVVARFDVSPLLGHASGAGWAGWNALLFGVALCAASLSSLGQRLARQEAGLGRKVLASAAFVALPLVVLGILYAGFVLRAGGG